MSSPSCCLAGLEGVLHCLGWQATHEGDATAYPPPCLRTGGPPCETARMFLGGLLEPTYFPPDLEPFEPEPFDVGALIRDLEKPDLDD